MLPKEYRLKKRNAFNATYRIGVSYHSEGITVFLGKKKSNDIITKIGFVVSKKTHKSAVKRNRIKRLMRESVRLYIKANPDFNPQHISIVFVASQRVLNKNFNEIDVIMKKFMSKIDA